MNRMNELDLQMTIGQMNQTEMERMSQWVKTEQIYNCEDAGEKIIYKTEHKKFSKKVLRHA